MKNIFAVMLALISPLFLKHPTQNPLMSNGPAQEAPSSQPSTQPTQTERPWGVDAEPRRFQNKVAVLKNGDVWLVDLNGNISEQVTHTGGKVDSFSFSPSLKYLAYSKILKTEYLLGDNPEPGDKGRRFDVTSVVIMDLSDGSIKKEVTNADHGGSSEEGIDIDRWASNSRIDLTTDIDGLSVYGPVDYDIVRDEFNPPSLWATFGAKPTGNEGDFSYSDDGTKLAYGEWFGYASSTSYAIHVVDTGRMQDKIVLSKSGFSGPALRISHDGKKLAFIDNPWTPIGQPPAMDTVWIMDLDSGKVNPVYLQKSDDKFMWAGVHTFEWSYDDRYLGMSVFWKPSIIDLKNTSVISMSEGEYIAGFTKAGQAVIRRYSVPSGISDVYIYDPASGNKKLLMANSSNPEVL